MIGPLLCNGSFLERLYRLNVLKMLESGTEAAVDDVDDVGETEPDVPSFTFSFGKKGKEAASPHMMRD